VLATGHGGAVASPAGEQSPGSLVPPAAAPGQRVGVVSSLSLEDARTIIDAAVAQVRAEGGRAAIAVVDDSGGLVSLDRMDGASRFFQRFAIGKAVGAVALQQSTGDTAEEFQRNPARYFSALSMLEGEVFFTRGGVPIIVDG